MTIFDPGSRPGHAQAAMPGAGSSPAMSSPRSGSRRSRRRSRKLYDLTPPETTMGRFQQGVANERYALVATPAGAAYLNYIFQQREASMPPVPKVDQGQVTAAIAAGRSAAHGDDTVAAEETVRLARLGGPDAVTFLRHVVRTERSATVAQRVRAACAVLEVGGSFRPKPSPAERSGNRKGPTAPPSAGVKGGVSPIVSRREEWQEQVKLTICCSTNGWILLAHSGPRPIRWRHR